MADGRGIVKWYGSIITNPIGIGFVVFILAGITVSLLTALFRFYDLEFGENVLVEAHGMLFDILVIGVFILWLNRKGEKRIANRRYEEEIDDFRDWESDEASHRIRGNIKRLNRNGISKIDLRNCYLKSADLEGANLRGANLRRANLRRANLEGADLGGANLPEANLPEANLRKANLLEANLKGARGLTLEQLSKVKTLYNAELDSALKVQIEKEHPDLL